MDGMLFEKHLTTGEIEAGIDHVLRSPADEGRVEMIVVRPAVGERRETEEGELDVERGLVGDNWFDRGSKRTGDGSAHPEMQLNIMNYRFAALIAGPRDRVPLAGDQLFVDLDLSAANLPPGTRLSAGTAVIEVTSILQKIRRALWHRCDEIRQFRVRPPAQSSRHKCKGRSIRNNPRWGHGVCPSPGNI
jgi:hypothetical protein